MKKLITIAAILISFCSYGQIINKSATNNAWNRVKADSAMYAPLDTFQVRPATQLGQPVGDSGRIAYKNQKLYYHNSNSWVAIPGITDLSNYYTKPQSDSIFYKPAIYVESVRLPGISDDSVINRALRLAGKSGVILLQPNRVYTIYNSIIMDSSQSIMGDYAKIKRGNSSITTLSANAGQAATSITVTSVPADWKVGDRLQVYTTDSGDKSIFNSRIIVSIAGTTVGLASALGASNDGTITTWVSGSGVRKVFTMVTTGYDVDKQNVSYSLYNIKFDGNNANNAQNRYWFVNAGILLRGINGKVIGCEFRDMPNESIVGHGFSVENCNAVRLWGSFVHLSGQDTAINVYEQRNAFIYGNFTDSTNLATQAKTGHSEGVITTSFNGGYFTATGNRFNHGAEAVIGAFSWIEPPVTIGTGNIVFSNNLCIGFNKIVQEFRTQLGFGYPGNNLISNNTFSNCGSTDFTNAVNYGMSFINNNLTDGTTVTNIANTTSYSVSSSGNFAIGENPVYKFNVGDGTRSGYINPSAGLNAMIFGSRTAHPVVFTVGDAEKARVLTNGNFGIATSSPTSLLQVVGSLALGIITVTNTTLLNVAHHTVRVNNTSDVIINLPAVSTAPGRVYIIKKVSNNANTVTITANGSETIDGNTTNVISAFNASVMIQSDGVSWSIL